MTKSWLPKIIFAVLLFGGLGFYFSQSKASKNTEPPAVASAGPGVVKKADVIQRVTVAGSVVPFKRTVVTAPYDGYIKKIFVKVGETVRMNAPVVTVVQSLLGPGEEVYPLRAPFEGTVVQVLKTEGDYIDKGGANPIVRIDDISRLFVVADVPEAEIDKIRVGQEAEVKTSAVLSKTYKGNIREIFMAAKEKKDSYRPAGDRAEFTIKIEITNKDPQIKSGMSCLVDIVTNKRTNVLTLPHEYVQKDEKDRYFVTLTTGETRYFEPGLQNEEILEIVKGLRESEQVELVDFLSLGQDKKK